MRVVGYCRVSTVEQVEGYSLATQRAELKRHCESHDWSLVRVFEEQGESAKTANRPVLQEVLGFCREHKDGVDVMLVHRLDRLARNTYDHHVLRAYFATLGIEVRSVTEPIENTPSGRFLETMLAAVAQLDNDVRADRTVSGMQAALRAGRWVWAAPVGYRRGMPGGPSLEPDPETAPIVRQLFEEFAGGRLNKRELRDRAYALGLRGARGGKLHRQMLDRMLLNPLYMGVIRRQKWGIEARGDFQAIVPEQVFLRVQAILAGRRPNFPSTRKDHPDFPLRRFVGCEKCGRPLTGSRSRGVGGTYPYYSCRHTPCRVRASKKELERLFSELLEQVQPKPSLVQIFREVVLDVWKERQYETGAQRQRAEKRMASMVAQKDRLVEAHVQRQTIDEPTFHRHMDRLREEETFAKIELHDAELDALDVEAVIAFAQQLLGDLAGSWNHMNPEQKRRFQSLLFPNGVTFDGERFGTTETASVFKWLEPATRAGSGLASPRRFELRLPA